MNFLRCLLLFLSLMSLSFAKDQNPKTFPSIQSDGQPEELIQKEEEEQLEMQKEEEELDSFGEDEFNQNIDPDVYKVDEK